MAKTIRYFFVVGRNEELSIMEIIAFLCSKKYDFSIIEYVSPVLIVEISRKFNADRVSKILAGCIKIGRVWLECNDQDLEQSLLSSSFYIEDFKKISYNVETYGERLDKEEFIYFFKSEFKSQKQKAFLKKLPPHSLAKSVASPSFIDVVIVRSNLNKNQVYFGRTSGGHDINENKKRYEKRPFVDESIGTSIRVARILVNLSGLKENQVMVDPFCGIGTVMQEALLLGINAKGIELNKQRSNQCKENLKWTRKNYNVSKSFEVFNGDSRFLNKYISSQTVDAIVTEPELGPFLKTLPDQRSATKTLDQLKAIYKPLVLNSIDLIKPGGKFVMVLPRFKTKKSKSYEIPIRELFPMNKFRPYDYIVENKIQIKGLDSSRVTIPIIYKEKWHKIERLIYIFERI